MQQVMSDASRTFRRFPFVLADAAAGTIAALILLDHEGPPAATILFKILFAAILGIPFLTTIALTAEKRKWGRGISVTTQLVGVLLLAAYSITVPSDLNNAPNIHLFRLLMISAGLGFLVTFAPFSHRGEMNGFWHYNKTLLLRLLSTAVYSFVLFAGLSLALAALDNLFGIDVPGKRYAELWVMIVGLFTTWFFLAGVSEDLDSLEASTDYPKALKIFTQYVLLPLIFVYFVILYAYLIKIIVTWDWPNGWVGGLILGYATAGILSLLLLFPVREHFENIWIKTASRWFYVIMIPLVVMLLLAVWRRVSEYGTTEARYIAMAIGIWLGIMVIYYLLSKTKSIKVIPGTLCLLSFFISFGPWGAFEVSENSQIERLQVLLIKNAILVNGSIHRAEKPIPVEDSRQISSVISYLHNVHGYDHIRHWFSESLGQDSLQAESGPKDPAQVVKMMGLEYVRDWFGGGGNNIVFNAKSGGVLHVDGYDRMLNVLHVNGGERSKSFPDERVTYRFNEGLDSLTLIVSHDENAVDSLSVGFRQMTDSLLRTYGDASTGEIPPEKMMVSNESSALKIKVCVRQLHLHRQEKNMKHVYYDLSILYAIKLPLLN